ncbi:hemolysin XhlA family protein [Bacillus sp. 2205SS5-2]|uniref:hemolysin XhlA family protein n=1 Tax=Bacillus sp. 2205SS5-2 TaxID=3109031 RepID=UPI003005FE15
MEQQLIKIEAEVGQLKHDYYKDINDVKTRLAVAESNISDIKEDLSSIKTNTDWLRRSFANAGIVGIVSLVVTIAAGVTVWLLTN